MADVSQIVLKDANGNVIGTYNVKDATVPHDSKAASSGGTTLSLVTTGEKETWNNKMNKVNPSGSGTFSLNGNASGELATAIGVYSSARGDFSFALGAGTIAKNSSQHVIGRYNIEDPEGLTPSAVGKYLEIVGNGGGDSRRSNARTLDWNGNEVLAGGLTCTGVNGIYWSPSKDTYSNTSVTFTTSDTISSGHFIWIIGDANQQPIFSILAIHTTIRIGNLKNLGYTISVGVSDNSITITAPAWSSIRLVSDLRWV